MAICGAASAKAAVGAAVVTPSSTESLKKPLRRLGPSSSLSPPRVFLVFALTNRPRMADSTIWMHFKWDDEIVTFFGSFLVARKRGKGRERDGSPPQTPAPVMDKALS